MIVLDTNVVSEPLKPEPSKAVLAWLDRQPDGSLFFNTISLGEMWAGVAVMPAGKRRDAIANQVEGIAARFHPARLLPFDGNAARALCEVVACAKRKGYVLATEDAQIAAIALSSGFAVATRDGKPFEAAGVDVINPWLA